MLAFHVILGLREMLEILPHVDIASERHLSGANPLRCSWPLQLQKQMIECLHCFIVDVALECSKVPLLPEQMYQLQVYPLCRHLAHACYRARLNNSFESA